MQKNIDGGAIAVSSQKKVTDCLFMLAPMTEDYEKVILGALAKLDTSSIKADTAKLGTLYSGRCRDVIDAVEAFFAYAYKQEVHMSMEMTLTNRIVNEDSPCCQEAGSAKIPYDVGGPKAEPVNAAFTKELQFPVDCRFAVYTKRNGNCLKMLGKAAELAKKNDIYSHDLCGNIVLNGDVHDVFGFFAALQELCQQEDGDFVIEAAMSVNSPTVE